MSARSAALAAGRSRLAAATEEVAAEPRDLSRFQGPADAGPPDRVATVSALPAAHQQPTEAPAAAPGSPQETPVAQAAPKEAKPRNRPPKPLHLPSWRGCVTPPAAKGGAGRERITVPVSGTTMARLNVLDYELAAAGERTPLNRRDLVMAAIDLIHADPEYWDSQASQAPAEPLNEHIPVRVTGEYRSRYDRLRRTPTGPRNLGKVLWVALSAVLAQDEPPR